MINDRRNLIENRNITSQINAVKNNGALIFDIKKPSDELLSSPGVKQSVLKSILLDFKQDGLYDVRLALDYLYKHNVKWPELVHIENSLSARKPELIKRLLSMIKNKSDPYELRLTLNYVRYVYPDAPELLVIKRALGITHDDD